jgi:hypothetical protein
MGSIEQAQPLAIGQLDTVAARGQAPLHDVPHDDVVEVERHECHVRQVASDLDRAQFIDDGARRVERNQGMALGPGMNGKCDAAADPMTQRVGQIVINGLGLVTLALLVPDERRGVLEGRVQARIDLDVGTHNMSRLDAIAAVDVGQQHDADAIPASCDADSIPLTALRIGDYGPLSSMQSDAPGLAKSARHADAAWRNQVPKDQSIGPPILALE